MKDVLMIPNDEYNDLTASLVITLELIEKVVSEEVSRIQSGLVRAQKPGRAFHKKIARLIEYLEFEKQLSLERLRELDTCRDDKECLVNFIKSLTFNIPSKPKQLLDYAVNFINHASNLKTLLKQIDHLAILNNRY